VKNVKRVLVGDDLRIFGAGRNLLEIDSIDIGALERYSNMIAFDIDGDSLTEIILVMEQSELLQIIEWNGTVLEIETTIALSGITHSTGQFMIKCRGVNDCMMAYTDHISKTDDGGAAGDIFVSFFNSTNVANEVNIDTIPVGTSTYCFPKIRHIVAEDYDESGGDDEYIFTAIEVRPSDVESMSIYYIDVTGQTPSEIRQLDISMTALNEPTGDSCEEVTGNYGRFFTSPLVFDAKIGGGIETIVGFMVDDDPLEFNMRSYDSSGSSELSARINSYPSVQDATGSLLSNPFRANIFDESGQVDFCVMGFIDFDTTGIPFEPACESRQCINLLCASEQAKFDTIPFDLNNLEFRFDKGDRFNISEGFEEWNIISHSITAISTDSPNNDELLNSYGVFDIEFESCNLGGFCDLSLIFENPKGDSVVIPSDVEKTEFDDLIVLTSGSLFYLDDSFVDLGADIDNPSIDINPCQDSPIKINTTMQISYIVNDLDIVQKDSVNAKVIMYAGTTNEHETPLSANFVSGATFTFAQPDIQINQTISNGIIRLIGNDTGGSNDFDSIDIPFTVAANGVELNDCRTLGFDVDEVVNESLTADGFIDEGATTGVRDATNELSGITGLGGATLWLIAMLIIGFGVITGTAAISQKALGEISGQGMLVGIIAALFIDGIIFIIGAINGVFSAGVVFLVVLLFVITMVAIGTRFFFSSQAASGM